MNQQISEHFNLSDLTFHPLSVRWGLRNKIPVDGIGVMRSLCEEILEPIYRDLNGHIEIVSGHRCKKLQNLLNGPSFKIKSQHIYSSHFGAAVDIVSSKINQIDLLQTILDMELEFDEIKLEFPSSYKGGWVHISVAGIHFPRENIVVKDIGIPYSILEENNQFGIRIPEKYLIKREKIEDD